MQKEFSVSNIRSALFVLHYGDPRGGFYFVHFFYIYIIVPLLYDAARSGE